MTQWLTYWVIYAFFLVLENFGEILTAWIPFYYAFKLGFLAWLFMPTSNGGAFVYHHYLSPFVKNHAGAADPSLANAEATADRAAATAANDHSGGGRGGGGGDGFSEGDNDDDDDEEGRVKSD